MKAKEAGQTRRSARTSQMILIALLAIGMVMVSCGGGNANKRQIAENVAIEQQEIDVQETEEIEAQEIDEPEIETSPEQTDWLSGDFKLEFEEKPMIISSIMGGKKDNTTARYTIVRIKDKLYWHVVMVGEGEVYSLFCMENGVLMYYALNPKTKKAVKQKANFKTIEGALRWNLEASVYALLKNGTDKMTKIGTEKIAGIDCDVYKNDAELTNEKIDKETKGLEALAEKLGGDTKQLQAMKKQFGGMNGTTTIWIDPTKKRFIARKHVYLNMNGKITDEVTHFVTFFQDGNIDASEIPNMSEYSIQN